MPIGQTMPIGHLIYNQVGYASSEIHDSTQRKEIFPPTKTYCSFNKDFARLLILMQCINKLYLCVLIWFILQCIVDPCLTHWGRVTHICVGNLTIIGSDNGLSPYRRQAIIWTNAGILLIGRVRTNFSEISIEILTFSFRKVRLKASSATWRPFCFGLNVLTRYVLNGLGNTNIPPYSTQGPLYLAKSTWSDSLTRF